MMDILWQKDNFRKQLVDESLRENAINLTKQQQKIVSLLYDSHTSKQIAAELDISKRTVEYHLQNLKTIFQVTSLDALKSKIYKEYF
ncbi:MAG: helix-turn-helix transcriptional regulator [Spirochaetota bacterium]